MSIVLSLLFPRNTSLKNPQGEVHSLIANRTLHQVLWAISRKDYIRREFWKQLLNLLQIQDNWSTSGVCALVKGFFNNRPPQPRYIFVWNVKSVSNYRKILYKVKK